MSKCFLIVHHIGLSEPISHETSFVPFNVFTSNQLLVQWMTYQFPTSIFCSSFHLFKHSFVPSWVMQCFFPSTWNRIKGNIQGKCSIYLAMWCSVQDMNLFQRIFKLSMEILDDDSSIFFSSSKDCKE